MKISFIIVSYNTRPLTEACLKTLEEAAPSGSQIIVVDNNSQDGSQAMVKGYAGIQLLENAENRGFAAACNQGAHKATGNILCFVNSDVEMKAEAVRAMSEAFLENSEIGFLAPQLVNDQDVTETFAYGNFPTIARLLTRGIKRPPVQGSEPVLVDWISGAVMAVRQPLFSDLGGFDEDFFMYFEDIDLCRRGRQRGFLAAILPTVRVLHRRGKSLSDSRRRKQHYYRSQQRYFHKHYGPIAAAFLMMIRLPLRLRYLFSRP